MKSRNLWYIVTLLAFAMLPLAGCGAGSAGSAAEKGTPLTVSGKVDTGTSTAKTVGLAIAKTVGLASDIGTVTVYNAQDGTTLASGPVAADGSFSGLSFTLPSTKAILVFKAVVTQGTFRKIVPLDLSNPPAAGAITGNNPISIVISQDSANVATVVSTMLGLTGQLGDTGMTLASVSKTYADAAQLVVNNGGEQLAYSGSGLALSGQFSSSALLPAVDAGTLTVNDLNNIALDGRIISAFIPAKKPIVNFQVVNKATGKGIKGMRTFAIHIAKLMPELNGSNSYWLNYISKGLPLSAIPAFVSRGSTTPVAPSNPSADASDLYVNGAKIADGYKVVDHGDGSYTVTFGADITANANVPYDPALTHRIGISVRNVNVPGGYAGPVNPLTGAVQNVFTSPNVANLFYDFIPATGQVLTDATTGKQVFARDIVTAGACAQCHYKLALAVPNNFLSGHTGSRTDTRLCVMCHTSQIANGEGEFVTFIHRIHMGEELPVKTGVGTLVTYGEQTYPQDIRNCTMCHKGADVNNWKTKPSRKNCGSCHNDVDFASHQGGQTSDQFCAGCHVGATAIKEVSKVHLAVLPPDPASPEMGGANTHTYAGYLPAAGAVVPGAATIAWNVKNVALDANQHPTITFKFTKNGSDVVFNTYAAGTVTELMNGFVGSPSAYFAFAVPQDGIAAPVDYNASASAYIKNVWNGAVTTSTLTGPDASGYYTLTINNVVVPASAKMFTGGIGYTYGSSTTPLTQIDLPAYPYTLNATTGKYIGGLMTVVPNAWKVGTGFTGRRLIVSNDKCNACHAKLGIAPTFHSGQRNDAPTCTFCHNVNRVNSGWSVNIKDAVHSIHGAGKRVNKFSWQATNGGTYWNVTYPGLLRNCEQCHLAGMYDYSNSVYTANNGALLDSMLYSTVATGNISATATVILTGSETIGTSVVSPFVTLGASYGSGFSYNAATGVTTAAAATTLVTSPVTAACFSCHDTNAAQSHMIGMGGSIYEARSTALAKRETCLVCHGTAQNVLNSTVPSIKAVHRWW